MEAVDIKALTKRFGNHLALNDINLSIPQKSIYGLLGPNGAGKTTFLRIVNQIIRADSGSVSLFGEPLRPHHVAWIGYLPEERGLYKKLKIGEQLMFLAQLKGLSQGEAQERIKKWFKKFEISDWLGKKLEELSKGMAQKVQFISTVLHEPKIIILDEPFSGFDPINAQLITEHILALREQGSTIIFSTHRMESVEALCDHLALINKADLLFHGSKRALINKFDAKSFVVGHKGTLQLPSSFTVHNETPLDHDLVESVIDVHDKMEGHEVLKQIMDSNEIHSFGQKTPSMNDIFIELVNNGSAQHPETDQSKLGQINE